jgi:hypothetical protein
MEREPPVFYTLDIHVSRLTAAFCSNKICTLMASAEELGELFASLPAEEKQKFMHQLISVHGRDDKVLQRSSIISAPPKKAVNGFMAFRCEKGS